MRPSVVMELGLSDQYVQMLSIQFQNSSNTPHRIISRQFRDDNIQEFFCLLNQVIWQQVNAESDVNAKFRVFIDVFQYYYFIACAIKTDNAFIWTLINNRT
jgi:hypothetical protein